MAEPEHVSETTVFSIHGRAWCWRGLFAWLEGLFALGYRPKLKAELERRIEEDIARNKLHEEQLLAG